MSAAIYTEMGKRCRLCRKNKESRIFWRPINGSWLKICKDCWNKTTGREVKRSGE